MTESYWQSMLSKMEGRLVKSIVRMRLFIAFTVISAIFVAAGAHPAAAAGGPTVKTGYYLVSQQCGYEDGHEYCSTGGPYKFLTVMGYHFGSWGIRSSTIQLCYGGTHLEAKAIDKHTGRRSNIANAFACSTY
jgi:hypothetical protein